MADTIDNKQDKEWYIGIMKYPNEIIHVIQTKLNLRPLTPFLADIYIVCMNIS